MKRVARIVFALAAIVAFGTIIAKITDEAKPKSNTGTAVLSKEHSPGRKSPKLLEGVPLFSAGFPADRGYDLGVFYTPAITDRSSLVEVASAHRERAKRGRADVSARLADLNRVSPRPTDFDRKRAMLQVFGGLVEMYVGDFVVAQNWFERAVKENPDLAPDLRANIGVMRGIAALRQGEVENCVDCLGPSSCIYPIVSEARHLKTDGSRKAMKWFLEYLKERPDDLGVRWMLNIAAMTLGEHPASVPEAYRIMPDASASQSNVGRFINVAPEVGLSTRGPNMLGGSIFDDFNGDRLPDVFIASGDVDLGASLFVNQGDGTFENSADPALTKQVLGVNANQADFDNDGFLDVLILRGGWESPYRLSLLRNIGGRFEDVTVAAGLGEPIATQTAAWGDFDNDGRLDLFVGGEFRPKPFDPRNRSRLYRNRGDGTFEDVAAKAGVENDRWAKGCAWGDYDGDGDIDLYVSNMNESNRLFRNNRDGTFTDVAPNLGLTGPLRSFSCWFWDYNDDGLLDLFVTGFGANVNDVIADRLGRRTQADRPKLYRNMGKNSFSDVTAEAGLNHVYAPMGSNFADFDNDGRLDFYLATGRPAYSYLVPNLLFRNVDGNRFEDVTTASGTGHLQKGHGVSFADYDSDGDLDFFVEVGGQAPGDRAHNVLFKNPGHGRRSIGIKLVGTKANRSAIGAKLRLDFESADGNRRSLHRVIGSGSSFGGNSLSPTIGVDGAQSIAVLTVTWPGSQTVQTFKDVPTNQSIEIIEGSGSFRTLPRPTPAPARAEAHAPRR